MYIALTEEQAKKIRSMGISVVEYKRCVRHGINVAVYVIQKTSKKLSDALNTVINVWNDICEKFFDAVDNVRMIIEEIRENLNYPTSRRYKIVKFMSKLGYDKHKIWVATRHTRLARSNC